MLVQAGTPTPGLNAILPVVACGGGGGNSMCNGDGRWGSQAAPPKTPELPLGSQVTQGRGGELCRTGCVIGA